MITYTLTEAELVEDHKVFFRATSPVRVIGWICAALALLVAIDAITAFAEAGWCAAVKPLVFFSLLVLVFIAHLLALPQAARRVYRITRWLGDEQTFSWSDAGTEYRSSVGDLRLLWSDFRLWTEGKNLIVIFLLANTMLILPKRAFSEDQLRKLREHLSGRVGRPGKPARAPRS